MLQFLSNPFNDPSDPWYYVIGVLILLLIFGALALYVLWSGKRKNKQGDGEADEANTDNTDTPAKDEATENVDTVADTHRQDKE